MYFMHIFIEVGSANETNIIEKNLFQNGNGIVVEMKATGVLHAFLLNQLTSMAMCVQCSDALEKQTHVHAKPFKYITHFA